MKEEYVQDRDSRKVTVKSATGSKLFVFNLDRDGLFHFSTGFLLHMSMRLQQSHSRILADDFLFDMHLRLSLIWP